VLAQLAFRVVADESAVNHHVPLPCCRYQPQSGQGWSIPPLPSAPAAGLPSREEEEADGYGASSQRLDDDWV
jgi:hypothetical protein